MHVTHHVVCKLAVSHHVERSNIWTYSGFPFTSPPRQAPLVHNRQARRIQVHPARPTDRVQSFPWLRDPVQAIVVWTSPARVQSFTSTGDSRRSWICLSCLHNGYRKQQVWVCHFLLNAIERLLYWEIVHVKYDFAPPISCWKRYWHRKFWPLLCQILLVLNFVFNTMTMDQHLDLTKLQMVGVPRPWRCDLTWTISGKASIKQRWTYS